MKIPEDVFWNADIPFLDAVVENKTAYDGWYSSTIQAERRRAGGRKK